MRKLVFHSAILLGLAPFLGAGAPIQTSKRAPALGDVFHPEKLAEMDAAVGTAIADKQCPGGVLWFERDGVAYHKAYGKRALVPVEEPMTENTIFDAASLTKVIATTPGIMLLV